MKSELIFKNSRGAKKHWGDEKPQDLEKIFYYLMSRDFDGPTSWTKPRQFTFEKKIDAYLSANSSRPQSLKDCHSDGCSTLVVANRLRVPLMWTRRYGQLPTSPCAVIRQNHSV